jgi:hypothetical protein
VSESKQWEFGDVDHCSYGHEQEIVDSDGDTVAWVQCYEGDDTNARHIAAAPDLLEACQRLLDDFKLAITELGFEEDEKCAIAWAEEAIAKATGKDQS